MLIDNNGFLVYHPDAHFRYKHLIQLEPKVAFSLIRLGHMQQAQCKDFAWKLEYYTWKVSLQADTRQGFYEILEIENTNVYVIVVDVEEANNWPQRTCESCLDGAYGNETRQCVRIDSQLCQCPCHSPLEYVSCENTFNEPSSNYVVCTNAVTSDAYACVSENVMTSQTVYSACESVECGDFADEFECRYRVECGWCASTSECLSTREVCSMPSSTEHETEKRGRSGDTVFLY